VHGASKGTCVDIKGEWLRLGRQNAALNGVSDRIGFMEADAFRALADFRASGRRFDIVVVDPPSFLKSEKALKSASKGYMELNRLAMEVLNEGGILATFSCSHSMPNEVFAAVLKEAASKAKKDFRILRRCHQDKDHPIVRAIPETEYLKGYFLSVTTEGSASCRQKGAS
jgi:23S rRNA (cytosine1962-C5)-methyltransferase